MADGRPRRSVWPVDIDFDQLISVRWRFITDIVLIVLTIALGALAVFGQRNPYPGETVVILVLAFIAVATAWLRMATRPDHLRAQQSQTILDIANESIAYLRLGLTPETADEVCRLVLARTSASAVAITDRSTVLAFAGVGEDHHIVGGPIMTQATTEALLENQHQVLETREEIGCPDAACQLRAAVVVPLETRGIPVGTLKFYYTSPRRLNETSVTLAEGLARLLSTQLELSELDRQTELATRMELRALQAQINPHFLFNTLNTIAHFIRTDPTEAHRLLRQFATFYRRTLEHTDELITVERELAYTNSYLELEQARFGERLLVHEDVDEDAMAVPLPAFVIQPIVENSIQHGFRAEGPLEITIGSGREDGLMVLCIHDNGVGIPVDELPRVLEAGYGQGLGIALKNIDDRLKGYFGPRSGLSVRSENGEGTTVDLVIDLEYAAAGDVDDATQSAGL